MTNLRGVTAELVVEATGRDHREDPVLAGGGGPAGNARLTAWLGLVLLVLFLAELVTLLDVRGLVSWHVVIGALLVPPALAKTGSTGWRMLRYYTGNRPYRVSGPPPLILRALGPLVVITTLAVLGSGVALILTGPDRGRGPAVDVLGQRVDALMLHKAAFVLWAGVTGLHALGRLVPAVRRTVLPAVPVPGGYQRAAVLAVTGVLAVVLAVLLLRDTGAWRDQPREHHRGDDHAHAWAGCGTAACRG